MFAEALLIGFNRACRRAAQDEDRCLTYVNELGKRRRRREVEARIRLCHTYLEYRKGLKEKLVQLSDIKRV